MWYAGATLMAAMMAAVTLMGIAGEVRVYYIRSSIWPSYFMAPGFDYSSANPDFIATRNITDCNCRSTCLAVSCTVWSVTNDDSGNTECLLYVNPRGFRFRKNSGVTTYFREDFVPGTYFFVNTDRLLYVNLKKELNTTRSVKFCNKFPGHRLITVKTMAQYHHLQSLWQSLTTAANYIMVGLLKTNKSGVSQFEWQDGTLYNDTELDVSLRSDVDNDTAMYYAFYDGIFYNIHEETVELHLQKFTVYCQANPLGVEW